MTKMNAIAFTFFVGCCALTGCTDKDVYNPENGRTELKPESEYFDFATTDDVAFDVNYGKIAGGALLEVFTENPISYDENGTYTVNGEARYKIFADQNGCFNGKVELPKATSKVYIYSPTWGAPMCIEANVENGQVKVNTTGGNTRATAVTRAVANPTVKSVYSNKKVYSIVEWGNYGKIKDVNELISEGDLNGQFIQKVQNSLWKGAISKPGDELDNRSLVKDTKHVNTTIVKSYTNDEGQTVTVTDAELFLTFLTESGYYQSTIGYYYYKTNEVPNNPNNIEKFIIIPNVSVPDNYPYEGENRNQAPMATNTKIQLLFKDGNKISTKFPAGYTIGYFIIPNGFNTSDSSIRYSDTFIYSNKEWNTDYKGQQARFISLSTDEGTVVYGVEDGVDTSYEDVLFCIDANPSKAIEDNERPPLPPTPPTPADETSYRTYAYEDIWPAGGDYDLNDVIIEHKREIMFTSDNYVTKVVDTYLPVQAAGAATYVDAFAVQYNAAQRGTITLPNGAIDETETSSVILFADAKTVREKPFVVTREFAEKSLLKKDLITSIESLNPFIIAEYVEGDNNRTEVHLPKHKATSKANDEQIGAEDDAYYINKDGKYPFAIMIPEATSAEAITHFTPVTETVRIDVEYPDFTKWVESGGTSHNEWYLNYVPSR